MTQQRGADLLIGTLKAAGVTRIFTLSGNHIMPIFDAAFGAGIELIHVRHEGAWDQRVRDPSGELSVRPGSRLGGAVG